MESIEEITEESFKERIIDVAITCANIYQKTFVEYDYLICSDAFEDNKCQEIKAETNNYLHLLGINTNLSPDEFYQKCINKTLEETDFDFVKKDQSEKSVKGSVRQKIKALPEMLKMFEKELFAEQHFKKNKISCLFATADNNFTIGFVKTGRPKSLMRRNQLNKTKSKKVDLVLRKKKEENKYSERIIGEKIDLEKYAEYIKQYINENDEIEETEKSITGEENTLEYNDKENTSELETIVEEIIENIVETEESNG